MSQTDPPLPPVPGSDGFIDLGTLKLPSDPDDFQSSSSEDDSKAAALALLSDMRSSNSLLTMIKKQEYKLPALPVSKVVDIEGRMEKEERMEVIGGLVGDDGIVPPEVYLKSSSFSPTGPPSVPSTNSDWRSCLSESLLNSVPKTMKSPDENDMDEGAREAKKEVEDGIRSKDQYSMYSGFEKPGDYGDDSD